MFKKGGIGRRLLTMALIAIPWFFRDQFATSLDEEAREAQQVLSEKGDHEQHQLQNSNNREVMSLLARIDLNLTTKTESNPDDINAKGARFWSEEAKADGKLLEDDVASFNKLLPRVSMGDDQKKRKEMVDIAAHADTVAKELEVFVPPTETEGTGQAITLQDDFATADNDLRLAWKDLEEAAQKDQQDASAAATIARVIAWVCTAIGALVVGDWKKFLAGFTGGDDQTDPTPSARRA
jgi:hypothetical protein